MNRIELNRSNNKYPLHFMRKKSYHRLKLVHLETDIRVAIKFQQQMRREQMKF